MRWRASPTGIWTQYHPVNGKHMRKMRNGMKKSVASAYHKCIQYLEGPNGIWKDHDRNIGAIPRGAWKYFFLRECMPYCMDVHGSILNGFLLLSVTIGCLSLMRISWCLQNDNKNCLNVTMLNCNDPLDPNDLRQLTFSCYFSSSWHVSQQHNSSDDLLSCSHRITEQISYHLMVFSLLHIYFLNY